MIFYQALKKKTKNSMQKILILIALFLKVSVTQGQTVLTQGDLAFIGYNAIGSNAGAPNFVSLLVRKPVASGTTVFITNQNWNTSNFNSPISGGKQGTIQLVFNEPASIGQIIEVIFSTSSNFLRSTVGTVTYTSGSKFDFDPGSDYDEVYVYQFNSSQFTFISGLAWSNSAPNSGLPPNMVYSGVNKNAFFNGTNGNNLKCGIWTPSSATVNIAFNADLGNSFYDPNRWNYVTSNAVSGGYCPCNPDSTHSNITNNLYSIVKSNIAFDRYLYNKSGAWRAWDGSKWILLSGGPDWGLNTRTKEVILNKSLSLGSGSAPYTNTIFECAKLTVQDTANGDDGVTLTIEPGNSLKIHYSLSFVDNGVLKPTIYLKSAHSLGQTYYANLDPTSANLNDADGDFKYDLHIQYPGWHHFQSPISSPFNSISKTGSFQFNSGIVGTGNTFSWDHTISQWAPISLNDDFSSKPYTILFESNEVPCVLTIKGVLSNSDQDAVSNLSATYHNPSTNGNVPGWTTDGDDGWNFYGNPYLSALSTEDLLSIFSTSGNGINNLMNGLDNKIFVWQPDGTISNLTSNYRFKSFLSNAHGGDLSAAFLPPFQAFFMRRGSTNVNNSGFVKSKKYRKTIALTSTNSIVNKTATSTNQASLTLQKASSGKHSTVYAIPLGKTRFIDLKGDVLSTWNTPTKFGLVYDSSLFSLKFWPILQDDSSSIEVLVSHNLNNEIFTLTSDGQDALLLDYHTGTIHDFQLGSYTFAHSNLYNSIPRFKWIFNPQATTLSNVKASLISNNVKISMIDKIVKFEYDNDCFASIIDMNGRIQHQKFLKDGKLLWDATNLPNGIYIISSEHFNQKFILQ